MLLKPLLLFISIISVAYNNKPTALGKISISNATKATLPNCNPYKTIGNIPLPDGFFRLKRNKNSFAYWLENIPLKEDKTVFLFDGNIKQNQSAQFAVLNISVGKKNLQQCADAVMRLRSEYLFTQNNFNEISFKDNAKTIYQFSPPYSREHFNQYLERVFGMCGSASLSKQLKNIAIKDIESGDVFIRGGFPGHAVIVMDVAVNKEGKKIYLLAQSYMPAQDIHVLINPADAELSPWYMVNDDKEIITPEYYFKKNELKRW